MRVLLITGLLLTLALGACSERDERQFEEPQFTVQNSRDHLLRIVFEGNSNPGVTFLLEPGQAKSITVRRAPFSVSAYQAYGDGQAIASTSLVFQQEFTWEELEEAEFRVTIQ